MPPSPPPPSLPPSPPSPPSHPPPVPYWPLAALALPRVNVSFFASGDVSDYGPQRRAEILSALATAAGFSVEGGVLESGQLHRPTIEVIAASVHIVASFVAVDAIESAASAAALEEVMSTPAMATAFFAEAGVPDLVVQVRRLRLRLIAIDCHRFFPAADCHRLRPCRVVPDLMITHRRCQ